MFETWKKNIDRRINTYKNNKDLNIACKNFHTEIVKAKYTYNFFWLGVPILQLPQDLQLKQEIIWNLKPDLIIETGVAYGGCLLFYASMLKLLEECGEINDGRIRGIEINLYPENKKNIFSHPLSRKLKIYSGSSVDEQIIKKVKQYSKRFERVLVCLDSNHTHEHVLAELRAYASIADYIIVEDTGVEDLQDEALFNRPWGKGNSPMSAINEFLRENKDFEIDKIDRKLLVTANPNGYLKRVK